MSEANESGLMGVAVGGIADQINAHLPKVLHKIDQEVDHKINPALQPITNALVKVELKKQITKAVQPDNRILTEAMRLNDEAVKFKLASDEHGRYVEIERNTESQQQFNDLSRNELAKRARNVLNDQRIDNPFGINQGELKGVLSGQGNKEYTRSSVPLSPAEFEAKMRLAPEIRDSLDVAEYYDSDANKKGNNLAPDGFDYYDSRFKDNGRNFINRYNIAKNNKLDTNTIYGATTFPADENWQITELDNKKTSGTPSLVDETTPLGSVPEVSNSNIAQSPENVNPRTETKISNTDQIIVNDRTGKTLAQAVAKLEKYGWSKKDIDSFKQAVIDRHLGVQSPELSLDKRIHPYDYDSTQPVYHGTSHEVAPSIRQDGLKAGSELSEDSYRGGGYGEIQKSISVTPDYKIAENFALNDGRRGVIVATGTRDGINVVEIDGIDSAEDLNQHIPDLLKRGIDAVWLEGEHELAVINKNILDDNLDIKGLDGVKYKIDAKKQATNQIKSSINELKTRHFKLTGDNDIAFNAFAEAIQDIGNIEGYYDPKTNTVHIGELAEYVLNHEVVHKTLRKHMELRPEIMQATADRFGIDNIIAEYNQKGYGDQAVNGHTLDAGEPKDVRLAVEEKVADEFNTYLDQYQKGRANYYANKVGLSPTIRAWFDRIIEGLKEFFGQADKIKQFYAQLETGKFSTDDNIGALERTVSRLEDSIAYKRSPDTAKRALAGFKMVQNGWRKRATLTQLTAESAEKYRQVTGLNVNDDAKLILTNNSINHIRNSGHLNGQGRYGKVDTNPLTEADIANMPLVFTEPDTIEVKSEHGYKGRKISLTKQINKTHVLGIELAEHDGDFYVITYFNKSRSPQQVQASSSVEMDADFSEEVPTSSRPKRSPEAYADNIPQTDDNIKYKLSDKAQEVSDFYYNDHQSAAQLRQNLIDQLWQANKKGQGVDHIWHEAENALDDTYMVRASNNSPFYSEYFISIHTLIRSVTLITGNLLVNRIKFQFIHLYEV